MDIEFSLKLAPFDAEFVDALTQLSRSAFGQTEREYVEWRLTHMPVVTASSIETAANQENHAMARLNLAHGFSVSGVRSTPGKTQVLFSKQLDS